MLGLLLMVSPRYLGIFCSRSFILLLQLFVVIMLAFFLLPTIVPVCVNCVTRSAAVFGDGYS